MAENGLGPKLGMLAAAAVGIVIIAGLFYTGPSAPPIHTAPPATVAATPAAAPASVAASPNIDLQCLVNHIERPLAPFHFSFKKNTQAINADWEADITPNAINGTVADSTGTRPIHGIWTDRSSWGAAVSTITAPISGPASAIALVRDSSATTRAGTEKVNGAAAVKYIIDTAYDTSADASTMGNILGPGGFIRGTAWVTKDGCPVKFVLDTQMNLPDGGVESQHYESNVTQGR